MSKTSILLLFLISWTPAVLAVCDKACNTPFQCYERELCQFRDNAKADMAITLTRLTNKYQAELAATSKALMKEYKARLKAFEQGYTEKMAAEVELTQQVHESAAKDADQIRALLEELSANRPWQEAVSELKADIQRLTESVNKQNQLADQLSKQLSKQVAELADQQTQAVAQLSKQLSKQVAEVTDQQTQAVSQLSKVDDNLSKQVTEADDNLSKQVTEAVNKQNQAADQLSKRLTNVETRQTINQLSKRMTDVKEAERRKIRTTPGRVFRDRLTDGSFGPEMVVIPAGTFRMGDIQGGGSPNEKPVHSVYINRFAMGRYEVTFAEYDKFASATGRAKPSDTYGSGRGNRPVINVSWNDATAYAQWLTQQTGHQYRLPTEAQWEYAARAGTQTKYWWGNDIGSNNANCYNSSCGDSYQYTAPVGSFAANPFGLFDTAGNVWEWTCSKYTDKYTGNEKRCANGGSRFALRGGSWNFGPRYVRAAYRYRDSDVNRNYSVGFRLASPP